MLFNSIDFAIFLPIVFLLYWFVFNRNIRVQNWLLVGASYLFYGWWDWRFLSLILFSTIVDFGVGLLLGDASTQKSRKLLVALSLIMNLGLLCFFKYYNFFLDNFREAFSFFGFQIEGTSLNIVLPVGISFYTFQTLSYSLDIYYGRIKPTRDFVSFTAFVSFFPQLVAGPIERASHLLPQFQKLRNFDYNRASDGCRQILWGLFKKIVIADNAAIYANQIFDNYDSLSPNTLVLGTIFFAFQIYGDFSGYSDIAIGTARLFGFDLMRNFAYPYFSRDIAEFWRRWHISLSTWFRDYLYIPLGGSRKSLWKSIRNTLAIFVISGFWHGANWTFIVWGLLNAIYFLPLLLTKKNRVNLTVIEKSKILPNIKELSQILATFTLTLIAWVFFRSKTVYDALAYLKKTLSTDSLVVATEDLKFLSDGAHIFYIIALIIVLILVEWVNRDKAHALEISHVRRPYNWFFYYTIIFLIFWFGAKQQDFIYFQF